MAKANVELALKDEELGKDLKEWLLKIMKNLEG